MQQIDKYLAKWQLRHFIFFICALVLFLPFLIKGELIIGADSKFHITRLYEIIKQQQHGQFFPDIVQYSGIQNWGYGLNLFYPSYVLLPLIFLWRLLDNPVLALILFHIFIVYFALVMNYTVFQKASKNVLQSFLFATTYILTASAGIPDNIGMNVPILKLAVLTQFTSNIVFLFAPIVLISFYQIIFHQEKSFWKIAVLFSALSAMLSIPATIGLVLAILGMFIIAILKKKIDNKNLLVLIKTTIFTILLSIIFVVPLLEQRLESEWAALPNRPTLWGKSFFEVVIKKIFDFSDILSIFVIIILVVLFINKKLDKKFKYLSVGYLCSLLFLHSSIFPWWIIQDILSGTIQYTSRWDFIPKFIGSILVARGILIISLKSPKIIPIFSSITLLFAALGMYGYTLSTYFPVTPVNPLVANKPIDGSRDRSFEPTKDNLRLSLFFRLNPNNVNIILNSNFMTREELGMKPDEPTFSSLAFHDYRIEGQYRDHREVYADSLVKFDGTLHENMTSAQGEDFFINNLPTNIETVQAPITYLKGFHAFDASGNELNAYKNEDGFLEIEPNGSETVKITYEKTLLHKASIVISIVSWIIFLSGILLHKLTKGGRRRAKTIDHRTRLQRRRDARALR